MSEIQIDAAHEWLRQHGYDPNAFICTELGGGVSNTVILAESASSRLILKQSLGKLRVAESWESDRSRIFREAAAMKWLAPRVTGIRIPRLLAEDRESFTIAMEAAPANAEMWKSKLFRGEIEQADAERAGSVLGQMIRASWMSAETQHLFGDQSVFEQLRIDPYYRFTARRHPDRADYFLQLIARSANRAVSLVHGDFSPKNLLVAPGEMWVIDWEVVHFGDPSFDIGFLLNHLVLKSIASPQHRSGFEELAQTFLESLAACLPSDAPHVIPNAFEHLPALLLARVDGKSPVEYLDESGRERARAISFSLMASPGKSAEDVFRR